jgi:hypothetical protein
VATQNALRQRALVVPDKAERVYQFHRQTMSALAELVAAAGLTHPREISPDHIVRRVSQHEVRLLSTLAAFVKPGSLLEGRFEQTVFERYWPMARADSFLAAH